MRAAWFLVLCSLGPVAFAAQTPGKKGSSHDVFLVTIDTLRADHVHCYGNQQIATPAIDLLAKDGVRFTQAFTPSPMTNTSHATILTGLLPSAHGVTDFAVRLANSHQTWAELLKKEGYQTAAFIGAVILDSNTLAPGLDRGFDFYDNFPSHARSKGRFGRVERRGIDVVHRAQNWLTTHPAGPHFVWIHLYDPHDPYEAPPPYSTIYKSRRYDGEIAYADSVLGQFLSYLKRRGWYDPAIIVLVGDHGEGLGDHHENTHGIFLYDSTTHVPLILKLPKRGHAGQTVRAQVRTTDVLPTVLDLLGLGVPSRLDGESLAPYLAGTERRGRPAFGETDYPLRFGWAPLRSVREKSLKLIEAPRPEFYDLQSDPQEQHNQYVPWDPEVQQLRTALAELRSRSPGRVQASPGSVGEGTTDELRALGYFGAADAITTTNVPEPSLLPDPKDKIEEQNLLHIAMLASNDGRVGQARSALQKALELDAKSPTVLTLLGDLELREGDAAKAADYLRQVRAARPNDAMVEFRYAQALEAIADLPSARDALLEALKLVPEQFEARLLLGNIYVRLHDPKAAEDQYEAALLLRPGSGEAYTGLARALIAESSFAEAVKRLETMRKSNPGPAETYELLAAAYRGLGNEVAARRAETECKLRRKKNDSSTRKQVR